MARKLHTSSSHSVVSLDGTAGDVLLAQGDGVIAYEWSPEDRRALDLELRARVVDTSAGLGETPIVRYRMEQGHGDRSWSIPDPPFGIVSGTLSADPILPGRGLLLRFTSRRVQITFHGGFNLAGGAVAFNKIGVSVQPATGPRAPTFPVTLAVPALVNPFPMGAREFRIRDVDGQPFSLGAAALVFSSLVGQLLLVIDVLTGGFGDWQPIPVLAVAFTPSVAMQAEYR